MVSVQPNIFNAAKIYLFPTRSAGDQTGGVVNAESMIYLAFSNDR